jgi:hypothetical protein
MNPEIKAKWIAALRSGEYAQGRYALRDGDHFCCLGVLCDVVGVSWTQHESQFQAKYKNVTMLGLLANRFKIDIGLPDDGVFMDLNDIHQKSFDEIATYIEENL